MRNKLLLGAAAIALIAPAAMAQETTSIIRGTVTAARSAGDGRDRDRGQHTPTARSRIRPPPTDGRFSFPGLQPGGPYTLRGEPARRATRRVTDIYTIVQQPFELPVDLSDQRERVCVDADRCRRRTGDIVVTASRIAGAGTRSDGPQTVFTQADIRKVASVNRDVRDIERRDPFRHQRSVEHRRSWRGDLIRGRQPALQQVHDQRRPGRRHVRPQPGRQPDQSWSGPIRCHWSVLGLDRAL